MCGTATALTQSAWDVWHCHGSRAACAGCVVLPPFPCNFRGMCGTAKHLAQSGEHACGAPRGIALHSRDGTRVRSSIRDDFERRRRSDCGIACYTEFERCPAHSGSLVLVLAPLSLRQYSGAIYFSRNEPFASLPPHQDEPDDSDDDQKNLACRDYRLSVHRQPP